MPTGYTAGVESGEITEFRDYLTTCARAFGALIDLRDEPLSADLPEKLEPHTKYYDEQIPVLEARIAEITALTPDQVLTVSLAANDEIRAARRKYEAEDQIRLDRYRAMRSHVEAWQPPTPDHVELKTFMLQQIDTCTDSIGRPFPPLPDLSIGEEWRAERLVDLGQQLDRAKTRRAEEIQRTADRNEWIAQLRASIPPKA